MKIPALTPERQAHVVRVMPLARSIARYYGKRYPVLPVDEYISIAYLALCESIHRWDPNRGALTTFAHLTVRQHLTLAIRKRRTGSSSYGRYKREPVTFTTLKECSRHNSANPPIDALVELSREAADRGINVADLGHNKPRKPGKASHCNKQLRACLRETMSRGEWTVPQLIWELHVRMGVSIRRQSMLYNIKAIGARQVKRCRWTLQEVNSDTESVFLSA